MNYYDIYVDGRYLSSCRANNIKQATHIAHQLYPVSNDIHIILTQQ